MFFSIVAINVDVSFYFAAWLVTEDALDVKEIDYSSLDTDMSQIVAGSWKPRHCVARQRIAVVIPARNRDEHLQTLTQHLHPFLQSQHLEYSVFVVDQVHTHVLVILGSNRFCPQFC